MLSPRDPRDALRPHHVLYLRFLPRDAMLARYILSSCVCLCVCLAHASIASIWLKLGSRKQCHTKISDNISKAVQDRDVLSTGCRPTVQATISKWYTAYCKPFHVHFLYLWCVARSLCICRYSYFVPVGVQSIVMSMSVCLSAKHISETKWPKCRNVTIFLHVDCGSRSVLSVLWWRCNSLCTSGFVDDVIFSHKGLMASRR